MGEFGEGGEGRGNWGKYLHLPIPSERGVEQEQVSPLFLVKSRRAGGEELGSEEIFSRL